jgi:hypothetical protein
VSGPFKFAGFTVGQSIRSRDFEDRAGRGPCFIEGAITMVCEPGSQRFPYAHYLIRITRDHWNGRDMRTSDRIGQECAVPMEQDFHDYDNRVMLAPNSLFDVWSPDTVAECLPGVPSELYRRIWNDIVPQYDGKPRSEVPDDFDTRCLALYWEQFTAEERATLNALAEAEDKRNAPPADEDEADHARAWYDTSAELR